MSAVSRNVMPRSRARGMVATDSWSSPGPYDWLIPMHPSPSAETTSPWPPSVRCSMPAPPVGRAAQPSATPAGRVGSGRRGGEGDRRGALDQPDLRVLEGDEAAVAAGLAGGGDGVAARLVHDEVDRLGVVLERDLVDGPEAVYPVA